MKPIGSDTYTETNEDHLDKPIEFDHYSFYSDPTYIKLQILFRPHLKMRPHITGLNGEPSEVTEDYSLYAFYIKQIPFSCFATVSR